MTNLNVYQIRGIMKSAKIYMYDRYAGLLTEDENGFSFVYDADYLQQSDVEPISLTMPLRSEPYEDKVLFPFFDGLIPEGWLLLACCKDCIGAVSVVPVEEVSNA